MTTADTKEVQSLINICGEQMQIIRAALVDMEEIEALFASASPSLEGTPLTQPDIAALQGTTVALRVQADKAVWDIYIDAIVPSHQGEAL